MKECRRCLLREAAENDVYESVRASVERVPPRDRTGEELYRARLEACRSCDSLISGVCMKCGCYVELRAAYRKMKCPDAKNRRWDLAADAAEA